MAERTNPTAPEPATAQAELAEPADAPTEPASELVTGSVILGRALQDREGDLYRWLGEDRWLDETGAEYRRAELEASEYGPVREVLLVSRAAWARRRRVVEEAETLVAAWREEEWTPRPLALAAAVDAMVGDRAEPGAASVAADLTEPGPEPAVEHNATAYWDGRSGSYGWKCSCGDKTRPVFPMYAAESAARSHEQAARQPVPVPDSVPGFDRSAVEALLARSGADATDYELRQVVALLAERDQLRDALTNSRAAASDRIADRDKITRDIMAERDAARAELEARKGSEDSRLAIADLELARLRADLEQARRDHPAVDLDRWTREAQGAALSWATSRVVAAVAKHGDALGTAGIVTCLNQWTAAVRSGVAEIRPAGSGQAETAEPTTDLPTEGE